MAWYEKPDKKICKNCKTCQLAKRTRRKYGKVPQKEAEAISWESVCVDCIGPYTIRPKNKFNKDGTEKVIQMSCLVMIDPATSWFETVLIPEEDTGSA